MQKKQENGSFERDFEAFMNTVVSSSVLEKPKALAIGHARPFDPATFIGSHWRIWRGPINGDGLMGEEAQDAASLRLTKIDFTKVVFTTTMREGESFVTGEDKLVRHAAEGHICLDAKVGQDLLEEDDHMTLKWLRALDIWWFELPGTVLYSRASRLRYFLFLHCNENDQWRFGYSLLDYNRCASGPSAVLLKGSD